MEASAAAAATSRCRRHPRQMGVGVCALCLKERLLALIEEEDELDSARDCLSNAEMSPAHDHSMGFTAVPIFSHDSTSANTVPAGRRHVMGYSTQNVKQMAALYLNKHQSLTFFPLHPQPPPIKTASPPPSLNDQNGRKSSYFDSKSSYLNSNSSLFTLTKADYVASDTPRKKRSSLWSLLNRHADESVSKDSIKFKQQRKSTGSSYITHMDGDGSYKLSHTSSLREVHDSINKADASSLLSSPHVASPVRPSAKLSHMLSPSSKQKVTSRGRQLYALRSMNRGVDEDRKQQSSSWISSLFPRTARRSPSISAASDAHAYVSHSSRRHSASASPEITPRRKSVSFLDDEAYKTSKNMALKSPQSSSSKGLRHTDLKSPNHLSNPIDYAKSVGLEGRHGASSDVNNGRRASYSDCNDLNSPRLKLESLLSKRRTSVSIDCSRDVRVSPAPSLSTPRGDVRVSPAPSLSTPRGDNHHSYGGNHPLSHDTDESYHGDYANKAGSKHIKKKLPVCSESEEDKSLDNMSRSKSWSTAWSKTLSPMLGLRSKKKKRNSNSRIKDNMESHPTNHSDYGGQDTPSSVLARQSVEFCVSRRPVLSPDPVKTLDHKSPPQQYSFLSKDYSAFSFYFSPRHQQRSFTDKHNYSNYKNGSDGSCHNSRHSVDGNSWSSYPSLFKKSSPAAAAAGAVGGDRNGRGWF